MAHGKHVCSHGSHSRVGRLARAGVAPSSRVGTWQSRGQFKPCAMTWRTDNTQRSVLPLSLGDDEPITFHIKARRDSYEFAYSTAKGRTTIGTVAPSSFMPLFTGVHLGIYAQGSNETLCRQSALFKYAKWTAA